MQDEICACILLLKMLVTSTYKIYAVSPIVNTELINTYWIGRAYLERQKSNIRFVFKHK